jgi:hypothetical protein
MNQLPLVVSFYTSNTPYEQEVQGLVKSCQRWNIEHQIDPIASSGSWELNCAFKPLFLLQKMEKVQRPLLWVDADAIFQKSISWEREFSWDLAVKMYEGSEDHPSKIVSSAVFINATEGGKKILRLWADMCFSMLQDPFRLEEVWDQDALRKVLFSKNHGAIWGSLSPSYSIIEGHPQDQKYTDPVLVQYQASRRYKRWIDHPEERLF